MKDIEMAPVKPEKAPLFGKDSRSDKRLFAVAPAHPFLSRSFSPALGWAIVQFLAGFFLAWIMCMAAFKYVFATLFAV